MALMRECGALVFSWLLVPSLEMNGSLVQWFLGDEMAALPRICRYRSLSSSIPEFSNANRARGGKTVARR